MRSPEARRCAAIHEPRSFRQPRIARRRIKADFALFRSCSYVHDRKNWNFCWTEVDARQAGVVQSLITTCRLHDVDPYTYLADVLQRVGQHPAARVAELTPRLWKQHFAYNPMRSDLYQCAA